jgi:hypothetical protein
MKLAMITNGVRRVIAFGVMMHILGRKSHDDGGAKPNKARSVSQSL